MRHCSKLAELVEGDGDEIAIAWELIKKASMIDVSTGGRGIVMRELVVDGSSLPMIGIFNIGGQEVGREETERETSDDSGCYNSENYLC